MNYQYDICDLYLNSQIDVCPLVKQEPKVEELDLTCNEKFPPPPVLVNNYVVVGPIKEIYVLSKTEYRFIEQRRIKYGVLLNDTWVRKHTSCTYLNRMIFKTNRVQTTLRLQVKHAQHKNTQGYKHQFFFQWNPIIRQFYLLNHVCNKNMLEKVAMTEIYKELELAVNDLGEIISLILT